MSEAETPKPDEAVELPIIAIPSTIVVNEFAKRLELTPARVVGELMKNGVMATLNESIDFDTAAIIGTELGFNIELEEELPQSRPSDEIDNSASTESASVAAARPPIVAVMGHVDHGKTSLLDAIRSTNIVGGESGGITQHIGAYQVEKNKRVITFLDTPGHEAFAALREHGARTCDIAIIVVAADDGVKPQTKEAIDHAKAAKVSLVVAINKVDKTGADVNRVKQELSEIGVLPDDWGGDVPCVEVSAKTDDGIDKLLDVVLLVADIIEPKAVFEGLANGVVIESHLDTGRGPVATLLIQNGSLKVGDWVVVGASYGKLKSIEDYQGNALKKATPAMPVVVSGLKSQPEFGDWFEEVASEKTAKDWVVGQARKASIKSLTATKSMNSADIARAVIDGKVKELSVLVKADAQGSLESLSTALENIGNEEVRVRIVSTGLGDISENDVNAATAANAIILGFHVGVSGPVNQQAKRLGVEYKLYKVIYELLDDVRDWLSSLLEPETIETEHARLKILGVFKNTKNMVICGGKVTSGKITPDLLIKIIAGKEEAGLGKLDNLQKNKEAAKEVVEGEECGLSVETKTAINVGDELVFYSTEQRARKL